MLRGGGSFQNKRLLVRRWQFHTEVQETWGSLGEVACKPFTLHSDFCSLLKRKQLPVTYGGTRREPGAQRGLFPSRGAQPFPLLPDL